MSSLAGGLQSTGDAPQWTNWTTEWWTWTRSGFQQTTAGKKNAEHLQRKVWGVGEQNDQFGRKCERCQISTTRDAQWTSDWWTRGVRTNFKANWTGSLVQLVKTPTHASKILDTFFTSRPDVFTNCFHHESHSRNQKLSCSSIFWLLLVTNVKKTWC